MLGLGRDDLEIARHRTGWESRDFGPVALTGEFEGPRDGFADGGFLGDDFGDEFELADGAAEAAGRGSGEGANGERGAGGLDGKALEARLRAALEAEPDCGATAEALGGVLLAAGRPEEARAVLTPTMARCPEAVGVLVLLARVAAQQGEARRLAESFFESSRPSGAPGPSTQAAATTGPASGPRPASS